MSTRKRWDAGAVLQRLATNPLLLFLALILGIVASVATIFADRWPLASGNNAAPSIVVNPATAPPPQSLPEITPGSSGGPTPVESSVGVREGTCLRSAGAVECADAHDAEILSVRGATCERSTIVSYMGGQPTVDVLAPWISPVTHAIDGRPVCLAKFSKQVTGSMKGAFAGADSAQWRWCRDTKRSQKTVPCNEPHDAEDVAVREVKAAPFDCRGAAALFVNTNWRQLEDHVSARAIDESAQKLCLVEVLGDAQLNRSLRNNGSNTLPIEPRRG